MSWVRIGLMVGGVLAALPLAILFGLGGLLIAIAFVFLAAIAKA